MTTETTFEKTEQQNYRKYYHHVTPVRRFASITLRTAFRLFTISSVKGTENMPYNGAVILAANHLTNFDVFLLQFALSRPLYFMGKAELFQNPFQDWLLRQLGGFPVQRGERDIWALKHAEYLLEEGQVLGMFPEGTRSLGKGLRIAKTGTARLAMRTQCPIVPIAIFGTQNILKSFPRRTSIQISIGEPLSPETNESQHVLSEQMMLRIAEMLPLEARGAYR